MAERKGPQPEMRAAVRTVPGLGWRRGALGSGTFVLVVALFLAAGAKGSLGPLPLYVAGLGVLLILVAAVAGLVTRLMSESRLVQDRAAKGKPWGA